MLRNLPFASIEARASSKPDTGEILLYADVGPYEWGMVDERSFADALKQLGDVKTINLRINSAGGSAFSGVAIYNQLKRHPARVEVDVDGLAASIASVIAMAGDEIRMGEGAQMMIHDASSLSWGNAESMRRTADLLDTISGDLAEIYARRSGRSVAEIRDLMKAETWFTAAQAVDAKLADVVTAVPVQARMDPQVAARFRYPPKNLLSPRQTVDEVNSRAQARKAADNLVARAAEHQRKEPVK
ncbi:MAG: head maturation protease, ClpP-related [Pseudomonadota bacterium]